MKRAALAVLLVAIVVAASGASYFLGYRAASEEALDAELAGREREFTRAMDGVLLEGTFTARGSQGDELREEAYAIERVEKIAGEYWVFHARIRFGDNDISLPVPVRLLWAGDTPIVSLTDASLPGLGTFTARVLFYRDRYAGLWWASDASGHQFGRIVRERSLE